MMRKAAERALREQRPKWGALWYSDEAGCRPVRTPLCEVLLRTLIRKRTIDQPAALLIATKPDVVRSWSARGKC